MQLVHHHDGNSDEEEDDDDTIVVSLPKDAGYACRVIYKDSFTLYLPPPLQSKLL